MAVLDSSISNIALPTISSELGTSPAASIWVVNAYQIAVAMLLLSMASLGENIGYRWCYMGGLVVFAGASLACALSGSLTALSISRFVQGLGGAAIMSMNGALIRFIFPSHKLARGIGYNALVVAVASAAGPTVAAGILSIASWRWLFAINVPIALLSLAIAWRTLPSPPAAGRRFDTVSAVLTAITFAGVFLTGTEFAHGSLSPLTATFAAAGIGAAILVVWRSRGNEAPLVPLDLLSVRILRLAYMTSILAFSAQMCALVSLPFVLNGVFGLSHVEVGLMITPMAVGTAVTAPVAGHLADRFPPSYLAVAGLSLLMAAMLTLGLLTAQSPIAIVVAAMVVAGVGFGIFQTPNNRIMLGSAPARRSGAAAGMLATMRLIGQTCGAIVAALMLRLLGAQTMEPLFAAFVLAAMAALLGLFRVHGRQQRKAAA